MHYTILIQVQNHYDTSKYRQTTILLHTYDLQHHKKKTILVLEKKKIDDIRIKNVRFKLINNSYIAVRDFRTHSYYSSNMLPQINKHFYS